MCASKNATSPQGLVIPGAGVAVRDASGRLLLIRRRIDDCWALPGGHIEFGESFADCARREFREETGFDVELTGLLGIYSEPEISIESRDGGPAVHYLGVLFEGRQLGSVGTPDDAEVTELGWFNSDELPSPLWAPDAHVIRDALSSSARPFLR